MMTPAEAIAKALADGSAVETGRVNTGALLAAGSKTVGESLGREQSEYDFQNEIVEWANAHGWAVMGIRPVKIQRGDSVYHETPFFAQGVGWPDLTLVRGSEIIFVEVKTAKGVVSEEQRAWLQRLVETGAAAGICRPVDWPKFKAKLAEVPA